MFALSLRLGLRPGEAAALYWDAIDDGAVNVTRGIRRIGNRVEVSEEVKTSGSRRRIELPDDLIEWFAEHRRRLVPTAVPDSSLNDPNRGGQVVCAQFAFDPRSPVP